MVLANIDIVKDSLLCFGCGTCNLVCNKGAIIMKYDNIGRLLPIINEDKCIRCGLCLKACPGIDNNGIQIPKTEDVYVGTIINTYVAKSKDEQIYRNAQSGGLVTATLKHLFEKRKIDAAIVCQVDAAIDYTPKAVIITSISQLANSQKSSYIPIDMISELKFCNDYHSIAFVGTGCHIQGVEAVRKFKASLGNKISYTLGLICDRTLCKTSADILLKGLFTGKKKKLIWRDKSINYANARILVTTEDGESIEIPRWKRFALKDPFTNPRCRICFDKLNTHADIVFGDPWGMSNVDWEGGMSVILTRTKNGDELISEMITNGEISYNHASLEEVINGQHIEDRKKTVSSAIKIYKKNKWEVPQYAEKLITDANINGLEKKISQFLKESKLSKDEIIDKNIKRLKVLQLKTHLLECLLFPIRLIKHRIEQ